MEQTFTANFVKEDEWYLGWVDEVAGANTQGRTLNEARENLREALVLVIKANRELGIREFGKKLLVQESITVASA